MRTLTLSVLTLLLIPSLQAAAPLTLRFVDFYNLNPLLVRYENNKAIPSNALGLDLRSPRAKVDFFFDNRTENWTGGNTLRLKIYSENANGACVNLVITPEGFGKSYWLYAITADWKGWKTLSIPLSQMRAVNKDDHVLPATFPAIEKLVLYNFGWGIELKDPTNLWAASADS